MIKGVHTMFYSAEADAVRAFVRDKLGFPHTDIGRGWLIFDLPEADMGCHPADASGEMGRPTGTHEIAFYCDDIDKTVEELKVRGVEFISDIKETSYGRVTHFRMPGEIEVQLYQPFYKKG